MSAQNQQTGASTTPVAKNKVDVLKSILNASSVTEQFNNALNDNSGSFIASVIDIYNNDSKLQLCDPKAVVMECLKAAVLKLPINKSLGFAYILPFNTSVKNAQGGWDKVMVPTFVPGYKGYIQMAMRTAQYGTINADLVYEGEIQKVDKLTGKIDFNGVRTSDKVVGYFAHFALLNGFSKTLYMTVEAMAKYAKKYSPGLDSKLSVDDLIKMANTEFTSKNVGWKDGGFNGMGLKTVLRQLLSKYGYLSIEMINAISKEIETESPSDDRDNAIASGANSKTINISDVKFEQVDNSQAQTNEEGQAQQPNPGF